MGTASALPVRLSRGAGRGGEESLPQQPAPPIAAAAQGRAGKGRLSRLETPEPRFEQQRGKKKKESCNFINNFT